MLNRVAERSLLGVRCGSTVAALLLRGSRLAIVWAGDSRVYRWRAGRLEQLTRDHSLAELDGADGGQPSNVITRAVGGDATLQLDVRRDRARAGDRYLLCSDGLTRTLSVERIEAWFTMVRSASDALDSAVNESRRNGFESAGPNPLARTQLLDGMKSFASEISRNMPGPSQALPAERR